MTQLRLCVLGVPDVRRGDEAVRFRTHKAAALLIYLALEAGPHPRDELAELLWSSHPDTARSALRLALHHLSARLGPDLHLISGRESLELPRGEQLWVDALHFEAQVTNRSEPPDPGTVALWRGEFMHGFTVQGAPAWDDWVREQQTRRGNQFDVLLARLAHAHMQAGRAWDAMTCSRRRIQHDPLNEDAYRQLAAQQSGAGLLAEAAATRRLCAEVLLREVGVRPEFAVQPRTQALTGANVDRATPPPVPEPGWALPLVGREILLQQMDDAWDSGKILLLIGEAGVGKSRLAEAFLARRQLEYFRVVSHPVDAGIPFSSQRHSIQNCLAFLGHPDVPEAIRRELSRIVPGLHPQPPPPLRSAEERLNFYEALTDFLAFVAERRPAYCLLAENAQYGDRESVEMGAYTATYGPARGVYLRTLMTFRTSEHLNRQLSQVYPLVEQGHAAILEVLPLTTPQVHELLSQLEPQASSNLAERMLRYTGGNPLFVLETARLLQGRGGLTNPDFGTLPRSPRISEVIGQRFSALSGGARAVLHAAAVAGPDFSFDLAAQVLDTNDLSLAAAFEELQTAGIFRHERFAHDLLEATASDLTPGPSRVVLHRRILEALRHGFTSAAALARHALGGRQWQEAHRLLMQASLEADHLLSQTEADEFRSQAAALLRSVHPAQGRADLPADAASLIDPLSTAFSKW